MNILVTGGAGFIGSNFVNYWLGKHPEDRVVVVDKLTYAGRRQNLPDVESEKFRFVELDICNLQKLQQIVKEEGIEVIVHFAAETHVDRSIDGPAEFISTNVLGTFNLLEILRDNPEIRLHHISTDEVFGELPLDDPEAKFSEATAYKPKSPYSASKAASDHLVRAFASTYGLKVTISNCSNNYGPYCFPEKLIPLVITRALAGEQIPVYGDGRQVRDWIHVEDHVRGVELILGQGVIGETYLLGGDGERENIWMVKKILEILEKPESLITHVGDRKGHDVRYAIDFSKAQRELGFKPEKPIETRLEETVAWYVDNPSWWQPLKPQADKIAEKYLSA